MDGGLVVRHEVLGVRPKHRFVLRNPGRKHTHKNVGGENRQEKRWLGQLRLSMACALSFLISAVGHARQPLADFHTTLLPERDP